MEKKKKRDKNALTNADPDAGDNNQPKEGDLQSGAKAFYKVGSASPAQDNSVPHNQNPPILQWPFAAQGQMQDQSVQFQCHSASQGARQQPHGIALQAQSQPQPQPQQAQVAQQSVAYWPHPELATTHAALYAFPPQGTTDSTMVAAPFPANNLGTEHATPYAYHGGYPYPMGYPGGPWDPSAWWTHPHHQPPYPYPYPPPPPPYGPGYGGYMPPPVAIPPGSVQKGIIRPPVGLSQKHQRLWEAQSMENVQLWGTMARLESELNACRGRVMKLEGELYAMKTNHDVTVAGDGSAIANTTAQTTTRKGRNKRSISATTPNLPSPDNCQPKTRGRKMIATEKKEKHCGEKDTRESKEREKVATLGNTLIPNPTSQEDHEKLQVQPLMTNGSDSDHDKVKSRLSSDFPSSIMCQNHVFTNDADNLHQYGTITQLSGFGTRERKDNGTENDADKKPLGVAAVGSTQNLSNFMDSRNSEPVEEGSASYRAMNNNNNNNRTNGWASNASSDGMRNMMLDSRVHPSFYEHGQGHSMRPDLMKDGKILSGWGYVSSEDHDDVVPSGKDEEDEEMDEDADSTVGEVRRPKVDGVMRLDSVPGISKGLVQMSRW